MCPGFPLWCSKWRAARCVGKPARWRVGRWPWLGLGWPVSTAASSAAAAGVRSMRVRRCRALGRLRAGPRDSPECTECNGELGCGLQRLWPRRRGAAAAMASAMVGNGATARRRGGRREGNGGDAHGGSSEGVSGLGEALVRPERRQRSRAAGDEDDEGGDDGGRPEVRDRKSTRLNSSH